MLLPARPGSLNFIVKITKETDLGGHGSRLKQSQAREHNRLRPLPKVS